MERLWIHPSIRRQKVASKILDVVRRLYSSDLQLLRTRVAFVEPNPACVEFAKAFLSEKNKNQYIVFDPADLNQTEHPEKDDASKPQVSDKENQPTPKPPKKMKIEKEKEKFTYELKESNTKSRKKSVKEESEVKELIPTVIIKEEEDDENKIELSDELF